MQSPAIIHRLRPRSPSDWIALVIASAAGVGVQVTDDWLSTLLSVAVFVAGMAYRLAPDEDRNGVPDHVERMLRIPPDVALLLTLGIGLWGCAGWGANLAEVSAEATATGSMTWAEGSGLSTAGDLACEASATGEVCYRARCVPLRVTVQADAAGAQARVCAHIGPFVRCEVVP